MIPSIRVPDEVKFPRMARVIRKFPDECVPDIEESIGQQLRLLTEKSRIRIKPGDKIAIAVGSRGVARIGEIVAATVTELRKYGAEPFIIPAMGSHGGATAEGQSAVLAEYGVTEKAVGAKVISSMEVVEIGQTASGVKVFFDRQAYLADGIVPINRIKKHTDFHGPIESGLMKMMAIGLGKVKGATEIHKVGAPKLPVVIPEVAEMIIEKCPILFGIGVVENAYGHVGRLQIIPRHDIRKEEEKLLDASRSLSPTVPLNADLLIVDEIGKDISGNGMDTSVVGRIRIRGVEEPSFPRISRIVVLDLTEKSEGNASGLGIADFTTKRLVDKIDFFKFYTNEIASAMSERGKLPMALATDKDAVKMGLICCWLRDTEEARVVRIKNTMLMDDFYISESLIDEVAELPNIISIGKAQDIGFKEDGSINNPWN